MARPLHRWLLLNSLVPCFCIFGVFLNLVGYQCHFNPPFDSASSCILVGYSLLLIL